MFANGHALFVGVPGLAKTLLIQTLANVLDLDFNRIQFTPDLMPSDVTGTDVLETDVQTQERSFRFLKGPIFTNLLLADEINRTPPKTQAALLQAMQEHTVTASGKTHPMPAPFHVFATQNPIEQEGTYPLPEAQLDRFMFMLEVSYPSADDEISIVRATTGGERPALPKVLSPERIQALQAVVRRVPAPESVVRHAVALVRATRPESVDEELSGGGHRRAGPGVRFVRRRSARFAVSRTRGESPGRHPGPARRRDRRHPVGGRSGAVPPHRDQLSRRSAGHSLRRLSPQRLGSGERLAMTDESATPAEASRVAAPEIDPRILTEIGNLGFRARIVADSAAAGLHRSRNRGTSVEFAEHKEYSPGDNLRHLDWRAYARFDRYYVKQFEDESNLRALAVVDASGSMGYPTAEAGGPFDQARVFDHLCWRARLRSRPPRRRGRGRQLHRSPADSGAGAGPARAPARGARRAGEPRARRARPGSPKHSTASPKA